MESSSVALIITLIMLVLYVSELLPIAVTSVLACIAMAVFGVTPPGSAFSGFGNDILFMLSGMMIVGAALFETGAASVIGKRILRVVGTNERVFIAALILFSVPFSAFLSNTATAAIMLPIAASAITASGGKLKKKNTYMMVGIACVSGGSLTLVSSTPQLIAQGLLQDGGHQTIRFFELSRFALPQLVLLIIYCVTIGHSMQKRYFDFPEIADEAADASADDSAGRDERAKSVQPADSALPGSAQKSVPGGLPVKPYKMWISIGALAFCVAGFITGLWSLGVVAMTGAAVTVATGCISLKTVFQKMDWTTVIVMGCSFCFASGFEQSGAGRLIAGWMITLLGDSISPWLLFSALALVTIILTNFMTSTATGALIVPIAIFTAIEMGYDVKSAAMAVAIAANIGYATPISTAPLTMTLTAGYRFKDYVRLGGLFNALAYALLALLMPLMLKM